MKNQKLVLVAAFAAVLALPLAAAPKEGKAAGGKKAAPIAWGMIDKDSHGSVSEEQFLAATKDKLGADAAKARFAELDKDHDGKLTKEEYAAATPAKKGGGKKKAATEAAGTEKP